MSAELLQRLKGDGVTLTEAVELAKAGMTVDLADRMESKGVSTARQVQLYRQFGPLFFKVMNEVVSDVPLPSPQPAPVETPGRILAGEKKPEKKRDLPKQS